MDYKAAFTQTDFVINDPALSTDPIIINVGSLHPNLDRLINNQEWCIITAWNPSPKTLTRLQNEKRNIILKNRILEMNLTYFKAYGQSKNSEWKEESFLITGCPETLSIQLGKEFEQMAILIGKSFAEATLIMLR